MKDKVAFLGLGAMGRPMAERLLAQGWALTVYNRTRDKAAGLPGACTVAHLPAEAVRGADVAVTMLADDHAVEEVTFGLDGILSALPAGGVHVCMGTIGTAFSRRLAEAHDALGQSYLAAPVFGRPDAVAAGSLWVLAGGPAEVVERCRPLLAALGQGVHHVAEQPEGANVVKLAGNFAIAAMLETLGETFALVAKFGIEPRAFLDVVNGALFKSPLYDAYGRRALDQHFDPAGFRLRLGLKDVTLALQAGQAGETPMPVASLVRDTLLSGVARGMGDQDWSALVRVVAANAGIG